MLPLKWTFIQRDWYPYKKRKLGHRVAQREEQVKTQGEDICQHTKENGLRKNQPFQHVDLRLETSETERERWRRRKKCMLRN